MRGFSGCCLESSRELRKNYCEISKYIIMTTPEASSTAQQSAMPAKRIALGRWKMLALLVACAAPVMASYFTYYVVRPNAHTNYGTLISPQSPLPENLQLTTLEGKTVLADKLRGNWLLVSVDSARCDKHCEDKLYWMRQLRAAQGKERNRVDRVWLITDEEKLDAKLKLNYEGTYTLRMIGSESANNARKWLYTNNSINISDHLYLIDPQGNAMMRYPKEADANKIKRDISRLMRASASWQEARPPQIDGGKL
jgi:cytochrome oxidase Cu insertion factor (SCO1/SenC/PrrC family)